MKKTKGNIAIIKDLSKLSERAYEVAPNETKKTIHTIVRDLKKTLKNTKNLLALCAPQLGYNLRIFCIKFKNTIMTFVNPLITHTDGQHLSRETNASLSSEYILPRSDFITAMYQDENGNINENKFEGKASELFEQMCQMLDGILISDYGLEVLEGFDELNEEDKTEILKNYLEYLKNISTTLDKNIDSNKNMHELKQAIDFMSSVAKGETEVVPEYNGELDFSQSTKVTFEKEKAFEEKRKEHILKKIEEIKNREQC